MLDERGKFKRKPVRSASPTVRSIFEAIDASGMTYREAAYHAKLHYATLSCWKQGKRSPNILDLEELAQVLGYDIVLKKRAKA